MNVRCSMEIAVKSAPILMVVMSAHVVLGISLRMTTLHAKVNPTKYSKELFPGIAFMPRY